MRTLAIALTALLLLSAVGFAQSHEKIELDFLVTGFLPSTVEWISTDVVGQMREKYPGLEVNVTTVDFGQRLDRLSVLFAGGTPPDIFMTGGGGILTEALMGLAYPVQELLERSGDLDLFVPGAFDNQKVNGVIHGIPWRAGASGIAYNRRLFSESGLDPDAPPETWNAFVEAARRLTRFSNGQVTQQGYESTWHTQFSGAQEFGRFIYQRGGQLLSEDRREALFDSPEGLVTLEFINRLYEATHPLGPTRATQGFATGGVAMAIGADWTIRQWNQTGVERADDLGMFFLRAEEHMDPVVLTWFDGFAIGSGTEHPEVAYDLIMTILSPENAPKLAALQNAILPRMDIASEMRQQFPEYLPLYDALRYAAGWPVSIDSARLSTILSDHIRESVTLETPPQSALHQAATQWNAILDDFWSAYDRD